MSWFLKDPPDFEKHNAEVDAVWRSYHEGRPHRVPVSVYGSVRNLIQNPDLNGYTRVMAYFPSRKIALALTVTNGQGAAAAGTNYSLKLFGSITEYLTPNHPAGG